MRDNLRLYRKMLAEMKEFLPDERITRIRNMALVVTGLFLAESVHLADLAKNLPLSGRLASLTNRLRRFLKNPLVDVGRFYRPVVQKLLASFEPWQEVRLLLDTTKVGFDHRVLTASLAYRKRAFPLCWSVHTGRKGHLPVEEQIRLLRRVRALLEEIVPEECAVWVMGDSEFGRTRLFRWVKAQGWHYVLRASGQNKIYWKGRWSKLGNIPLEEGQTRKVGPVHFTEKHDYRKARLIMHWAEGEDEPWYLLSDRPVGRATLRRYEKRMWTEEMYRDLKGHGARVEATNLVDADRIERLMLGICWMYVWLLALGSYVVKRGWRAMVDRKSRRDKSYFRIGLDYTGLCFSRGDPIRIRFRPYFRK
jgi:hypothetical protein